ncbi:MAG: FecR domain-containing protein [Muribaculaceae bacterium]|nr:FecR domain-containing protein [Muribaculaceae bacterium]
MDNQSHITSQESQRQDVRLESLLDACRPEEFDNSRIKSLVRGKLMREAMIRQRRRRHLITAVAGVAACVCVVAGVALRLFSGGDVDLSHATLAEVEEAGYTELVVAPGKRAELTLSDGTRLIANSRTRVLYPEHFDGAERRIYANGEVYLEVAKDAAHPFVVESNGFDVKVLGTVFNITNTSDSTASVVLVEGSVEVTTERDDRVRLKPCDMVDLVNGEVSSLSHVDPADYTLWIDGLMSLRGESLSTLAQKLTDHYGVAIECAPALGRVKVYGKLDLHDSIESVISSIREIVPMEIERKGDRIIMRN